MAPARGRRGPRTDNTVTKWAFLQPWVEALRANVVRNATDKPTLEATFHCWLKDFAVFNNAICRDCIMRVRFPADPASRRRNRHRLQRLREAIELFNALAAIDSVAFATLLADVIVNNDEFVRSGLPMSLVHHQPVWTCQLIGKLASTDDAVTTFPVSWGTLFGCPNDPWECSAEFQAAALQIEAMDTGGDPALPALLVSTKWSLPSAGVPLTAWKQEPNDAWGDSIPINAYSMKGNPLVGGVQSGDKLPDKLNDTVKRPSEEHFVREMKARWDGVVPLIAHSVTARGLMDVFEAWTRSGAREWNVSYGITTAANFESNNVMASAMQFAMAGITNFTLTLDSRSVRVTQWGKAVEHMGFLFSLIVCGHSTCGVQLPRQLSYPFLNLVYSWASDTTFAAITSALTNAFKVESVTFTPNAADEPLQPANPSRWKWLAFALFSHASNGTIDHVNITKFKLTKEDVQAIAAVMKRGYPEPISGEGSTAEYGYVDVAAGTILRPAGLPGRDHTALTLGRDTRCRAMYDPKTTKDFVHVVVPGHGICKIDRQLSSTNKLIRDARSGPRAQGKGVENLETFFLRPESGAVLTTMIALIGKNLRGLLIAETPDVLITVELGALAAACPRLEKLAITCHAVTLLNHDLLRGWGIQELTLVVNKELPGLVECLQEPTNGIFRQLQKLALMTSSYVNLSRKYVRSVEAHDGDCIAVAKKKLPMLSKAAVLSVMKPRSVKAIGCEANRPLRLIFEMAATPQRRSVQFTTLDL